jgi:hypothetical protein
MSSRAIDWREEFGIDAEGDPNFVADPEELTNTVPQAYLIRQAFRHFDLDGVLCSDNAPLIYFKCMDDVRPDAVLELHRRFWNHGGAPILVLVTDDEVHVYSGLSRPEDTHEVGTDRPDSLITKLDRVASSLEAFLLSVRSGQFFQQHARSFDPGNRVDRDLLRNLGDTRELLRKYTGQPADFDMLDALLCRLVFTCYLFDREVIDGAYLERIGFSGHGHLRDLLAIRPVGDARVALYRLFEQLRKDFNGDLFASELAAEAEHVSDHHIELLSNFFDATHVRSGQRSFWPYDFAFIPIETISAIYERFLKEENQRDGAFYTPRFLAELTLDTALEDVGSLLSRTCLDPACGSGIFLVGLFNRMADEWTRNNPGAPNDRRARELMELMCSSLRGIDKDPTACRITAFSLYLAYLDQLSPRGIRELQKQGRALPHLVIDPARERAGGSFQLPAIIHCSDFFEPAVDGPSDVDLVIGNPPWASIAGDETPAGRWCAEHGLSLPDKQIAAAFVWKAVEHISTHGCICLVLPYGMLFNHSSKAVAFQASWVRSHSIERVLNLADLRRLLFSEAIHPAIVVRYRKARPDERAHRIEYWSPKADWMMTQAEIVTVMPEDRSELSLSELLGNLEGEDAPHIWKQAFWGTPRDDRFLDRLLLHPRLNHHVRQPRDREQDKRWLMAEGFQPFGSNDPESSRRTISLPTRNFIEAKSKGIDLYLSSVDCIELPSTDIEVRRSTKNLSIFEAPHVLVTKGFRRIAFADFDVSFRHALRGIHGPAEDRKLLIFLAAYLRSRLAQYIGFHTSSNWGLYRPELHVEEVLRLPFPLPDQLDEPERQWEIVDTVASLFDAAVAEAESSVLGRDGIVDRATEEIEPLIQEYFDVHPLEKLLIDDTLDVIVPSVQPTLRQMPVPTVRYSTTEQQRLYTERLCQTLNQWTVRTGQAVRGVSVQSSSIGIGLTVLEKVKQAQAGTPLEPPEQNLLSLFKRLQDSVPRKQRSIDPVRGLMVFDENRLYIAKPLGQLHWTQTAALNDADRIVGTILMQAQESA